MKTLRTFAAAAFVLFAAASCQKTPTGDANVSFESGSYSFYLEDGPNFDIPIHIEGDDIAYPMTVTITDVPSTDESVVYSVRNEDWRFIERRVVVNSPEETPVVTVRCYNTDAEEFRFKIGIEAVDNGGQIGAVHETEITVRTQVYDVEGVYTASGILASSAATAPYEEDWTFIVEGTTVGFTGLLGEDAMVDESTWPIIGDGYRIAEGANAGKVGMTYVLGLENYINAYEFEGIGPCYVAPGVVAGGGIYLDGVSLVMEQTDGSHIQLAALTDGSTTMQLDESSSITYALYDFNTEEFIGYTYGGQFYVDGNTVTKAGTGSDTPSGDEAASNAAPQRKAVLTNVETGEKLVCDMTPIKTDRNISIR